jgi:cytochrome P450
MAQIPPTIPRATEVQRFFENPLGFLAQARSRVGDVFVLRDNGPIFSRAHDCTGTVAVFGTVRHQTVLSDIDLFGLPVSAAQHLSLPQHLVSLNRGLHSMRGEQHAQHQRLLMRVLSEHSIEDYQVSTGLDPLMRRWRFGHRIGLLGEMRQLALNVSTRLLIGGQYAESSELASVLQAYFHLRREAATPFSSAGEALREELIGLGTSLDHALRQYIRWCRRQATAASPDAVLGRLALLELLPGELVSEDDLVAHCNVLFMSSNEPIAVALAWILLILSQLPDLRRELRNELEQAFDDDAVVPASHLARLTLLDSVVNESLRLLPPNALMVRVTTRPASLVGELLPERCEVVLCPFLSHREPARFPQPDEFLTSRWRTTSSSEKRPSPFEYFPFGAGGHSCVGRHLGTYIIKASLALLMQRYEFVLAGDQEIDWRIHIQFMPKNDPIMTVHSPGGRIANAGKLLGPIGDLVRFDAFARLSP